MVTPERFGPPPGGNYNDGISTPEQEALQTVAHGVAVASGGTVLRRAIVTTTDFVLACSDYCMPKHDALVRFN